MIKQAVLVVAMGVAVMGCTPVDVLEEALDLQARQAIEARYSLPETVSPESRARVQGMYEEALYEVSAAFGADYSDVLFRVNLPREGNRVATATSYKGYELIRISPHFVEQATDRAIFNVLVHELAHVQAIRDDRDYSHGETWQYIMLWLGCDPGHGHKEPVHVVEEVEVISQVCK